MVIDNSNFNIPLQQELLLKFHSCHVHFNLSWIKSMIRKYILPVLDCDVTEVTSNNEIFKCMVYELSKYTSRTEVAVKKYFCK